MVTPQLPNIPGLTRDPVSAFLQLVFDRKIGDPFAGGSPLSIRGFGRLVGISESTLRTAFRTEGRAPSQRTLERLDAALRSAPQSIFYTRTGQRDVRVDDLTPLGLRYYRSEAPVGARGFRVVVATPDGPYPYSTMTPTADAATSPEAFFDQLESMGLQPVRVIWDVS